MPILNTGAGTVQSPRIPIVPGQRYHFHFTAGTGLAEGSMNILQVDAEREAVLPGNPHFETFSDLEPAPAEPQVWDFSGGGEGVLTFIATGSEAFIGIAGATADKLLVYKLVPVLR